MNEFAYVLITPYSLFKSRTGGIISRLLAHSGLELVAVKMYAPSHAMLDEYLAAVKTGSYSSHNLELIFDYVDKNLRPGELNLISNRCMVLFFQGPEAVSVLRRVTGHVTYKPKGDTIRGTFGDYITQNDQLVYFEPAVLCASDSDSARAEIEVFKKYACSDGGVISHALDPFLTDKEQNETTLVMLKPDTFMRHSSRPGNIIDYFSRTGLFIVGAKLVSFSIAQAEEFYFPLKKIFETKLVGRLRNRLEQLFKSGLPFAVDNEELDQIAEVLRKKNALHEFNRIIQYITGLAPEEVPPSEYRKPGQEKCLALLYYGMNAVSKVRDRLGSTNPQEAEYGTVRREFGHDILRNGVHASDSPENAMRERKIVGLVGDEPSELDEVLKYE